jgi:hypothetical protein
MKTSNTIKYPNGYAKKLEYWKGRINNAFSEEEYEYAMSKWEYFNNKQIEHYQMSKFDMLNYMVDNLLDGREAEVIALIFNTATANGITKEEFYELSLKMLQKK